MTHLKKTIQFFVLIMIFTHHTVTMPMYGHFSPTPIFSQTDTQSFATISSSTFKNAFFSISNNITNNPRVIVVIAAGCIVAIVCTKLYKAGTFSKNFNLDSSVIAPPIQKEIQSYVDTLPWAIKGPIKVIIVPFKTLMHLLRTGVVHYISYNKKHLGLSAVSVVGGYAIGHPVIGGLLAGGILVHGGFNGKFNEMSHKLDNLDKKLTKNQDETRKMLESASDEAIEHKQAIIKQVDEKSNELFEALSGVDARITTLGDQVSNKIEGVAQQVITMHGDVQKISEQMNALKIQLKEENRNGVQRDQKADETLAKLQTLSSKVDDSCRKIDAVALRLSNQQQEFATRLEGKMNDLNKQLLQQGNVMQEVKDAQSIQGDILNEIKKNVDEICKIKSEHESLVKLFKDEQANNTEILKRLQEGQAKTQKVAADFSTFYIEFSSLKNQFCCLENTVTEYQKNNTKTFTNMSHEQSLIHERLDRIEGNFGLLKESSLQIQQQNIRILDAVKRLESEQNHSADRPLLKTNVEQTSVPVFDQTFKQLPRLNTFESNIYAIKNGWFSKKQPLQLRDVDQ